ncbi:MAG: RodZ domain-containing protein [Acidobacteriota bacterium]
MEQLGSELKQAREASGISIHEMATRTKISITALECLERNDFSRLPGGIFGRAFVRAYATEVGMEADAAVSRFSDLLEQAERAEAERKAAMRPEITLDDRQFLQRQQRAMLILRIVMVGVVIALAALAIWQGRAYLQRRAAAKASAASAVPNSMDVTTSAPALAAAPVAPSVPAPPSGMAHMVLDFEVVTASWLSVSVDSGPPVFARLFQPGEHQRVEADREIVMDLANAGAVRMAINGRQAKPLGKSGERQRARITRDNLTAFLD